MDRTALVLTSTTSTWDGLQAVQFESRDTGPVRTTWK